MSTSFSEANLIKKLEHVTNRQDSIQTLSLWVLHHKAHYKKIIEQWLKCYTKAKSFHQLALFYLANDIVQHAKRKSYMNYIDEFMDALREAVKVTSDEKILPNINRVFDIWEERNVYTKEFIDELRELLSGDKVKLEVISKIVSDYSLPEMINHINNTVKVEQFTQSKHQSLINCKMDFANSELLNKLKDKTYGEQFSKEFDEASKCLDAFIIALEKEVSSRKQLLDTLEKSKVFYEIQFKEANTVTEAFANCELRVKQVKNKLDSYNESLSSPKKPTALSSDDITSSQLSVMNLFQKNQNSSVSSLDQRLTSLMSSSGHFNLSLDKDSRTLNASYNPNFQAAYNPSTFDANLYSGQYYSADTNRIDTKQIESVVNSRQFVASALEPTENLEPADMDLGNSDDEDGLNASNMKNIKVIELNKGLDDNSNSQKSLDMLPFMTSQEIGGMFSLIPPPPPPPLPPPSFSDMFGSHDDDYDLYRSSQSIASVDSAIPHGNSIRNLADLNLSSHRPLPYPSPTNNNNSWRNSSDNRQISRNHQSFNNFSHQNQNRQGNRWKNNNGNGGGSWKRNSYGGQH